MSQPVTWPKVKPLLNTHKKPLSRTPLVVVVVVGMVRDIPDNLCVVVCHSYLIF